MKKLIVPLIIILLVVGGFLSFKTRHAKAVNEAQIIQPGVLEAISGSSYLFSGSSSWASFNRWSFNIDSDPAFCLDIYKGSQSFSCLYDTNNFTDGPHTLTLTVVSGTSAQVAIQIYVTNHPIVPPATPSSEPSPSPVSGSGSGSKSTKTIITSPSAENVSPTPNDENPESTPTPKPSLTSALIQGRPDLSPIPIVATSPKAANITDFVNNTTLVNAINFKIDQQKPLHIQKLEQRKTMLNTNFLVFFGVSYPNSTVTLKIESEPIVMKLTADSNGNWYYILEDPLEPGKHQAFIEVNNNSITETSGPYPFNIAKARATAGSPTGASLDLIDPQKQNIRNYILITLGVIALGILILLIYLYMKRIKQLRNTNTPAKGIDAH